MMEDNQQLCTFFLGEAIFGIDVREVQEVVAPQEMTPVPLAPREVAGLLNLRGQIVTALELRHRLGLPARAAGTRAMNVVVRTAEGPVSLLVDRAHEVVRLPGSAFEPPPDTLHGSGREFLRGVFKREGGLVLVLDLGRVVAPAVKGNE
jgi:purine-binding chemotaxis protein CheW